MRRVLAAVVIACLVPGFVGCGAGPFGRSFPGRVLVLALGSDGEGATVPVSIVVIDLTDDAGAEAVDPRTTVTVPGTSYDRLRDAYPFSGGAGVAEAYASARDEEALPFVALSAEAVAALVGEQGVTVALREGVAAYRDGSLVRLPAGRRAYSGEELVALLASVDYVSDADAIAVANAVAEAVARAAVRDPDALGSLVGDDPAASDLSPSGQSAFAEALARADGAVEFSAFR